VPSVSVGSPKATGTTAGGFAGGVNPRGSPTVVHFEYGLDPSYRQAGGAAIVYDQATQDQPVGAGTADVPISASVSGLVPNALYHVRLVASNAAGTTHGPDQTFMTAADPVPAAPRPGSTENVQPAGGKVFVVLNGQVVPLTEARQLPSGTELDTRLGSIQLTAAALGRKLETGTFGGAVFRLTQARSRLGLTTLTLVEGGFPGAPTFASCKRRAALSGLVLQTLHGRAHGHFRTVGRYSAATVRGTIWDVADRCDGTLTLVHRGVVRVADFARHVTVTLRTDQRYLARVR
jgi:hypothetical protein